MEGVTVREMALSDLPMVHELADQSFSTPWSLSSFKYEIANRDAVLKVAEKNSRIIAYICIRSFLDATHVMDIAVMSEYRHEGIGTLLLFEALREIRDARPDAEHITLEVRESNIAAIKLYEKSGFRVTGRRMNYYSKPDEDGVIMGLDLDQSSPL